MLITILHVTIVSGYRTILWMYHILFSAFPILGHLGCFQDVAIITNTMINKAVALLGQLWLSPLIPAETSTLLRSPL